MQKNNAEYLLKHCTISEIQGIRDELQNSSHLKQEEMRRLICDKYGAILGSFDSVTKFDTSIDSIISSLDRLSTYSKTQSSPEEPKLSIHVSHDNLIQQYQSYYKLHVLTSVPTLVKKFLSSVDIDVATYLAMYYEFILTESPELSASPIAQQVPSLENIKSQIEREVWDSICQKEPLDLNQIADGLCSVMILRDETPTYVLYTYLEKKSLYIAQLLELPANEETKEDAWIEGMVLSLLGTMLDTIRCLHDIFFEESGVTSLLIRRYERFSEIRYAQSVFFSSKFLSKFIPNRLRHFNIKINNEIVDIKHNVLKNCSIRWVEQIRKSISDHLPAFLKSIQNISEISNILSSIHSFWIRSGKEKQWNYFWESLASSYTPVWESFFSDTFLSRLKFLIEFYSDYAVQMMDEMCERLYSLEDTGLAMILSDEDLSQFVWNENISGSNLSTSITHRSFALTPKFDEFTTEFDSRWTLIAEELDRIDPSSMLLTESDKISLSEHVKNTALRGLQNWLSRLEIDVAKCNDYDQLLSIGMFTKSILHFAPGIDFCLKISQDTSAVYKKNELLSAVSNGIFLSAYKLWMDENTADFKREITTVDPSELMNSALSWEEVEIKEEDADGKNTSFTISVPQQISPSLHRLLFLLVTEINRISAHTMPRRVIVSILFELLEIFDSMYTNGIQCLDQLPDKFKQNRSIQFYFDCLFIKNLMGSCQDMNLKRTSHTILSELMTKSEALIDPVDLQILYPHLHSSSLRTFKGSVSLFGHILPDYTSTHNATNTAQRELNHQNNHFILPTMSNNYEIKLISLEK